MKTTTRRHIASLAFIALLAIVYALILLTKDSGDDVPVEVAAERAVTAPAKDVTATDAADSLTRQEHAETSADKAAKPSGKSGSPRKKTQSKSKAQSQSKSKAKSKSKARPAPDNPGVFDSPVPQIR